MSATVIILPIVAKDSEPRTDVAVLSGLRLPRRVHNRLLKIAREWDVPPSAAAEMLLLRAINTQAGLRDRERS